MSSRHALVYPVAAFALFPAFHAVVKSLSGRYSVFQLMAFTAAAAIPLLVLLIARSSRRSIARPGLLLLRGAISGATSLCVFYGLSRLPMAVAYALQLSGPLFVPLLAALLLKERCGRLPWVAAALGFLGVLFVLRPSFGALNLGHLAVLAAAVLFAFNTIVIRAAGQTESGATLVAAHVLGILMVSLPMVPSTYVAPSARDLFWMAIAGLCMVTGHLFLARGLRRFNAAVISPLQYTQLAWGMLLGRVIFGDVPDAPTLLGAALIVGSTIFAAMGGRPRSPSSSPVRSEIVKPHGAPAPGRALR